MWRSNSLNMDRGYMWTDECGMKRRAPGAQEKTNTLRRPQKIQHDKNMSIGNAVRHVSAIYIKKRGVKKSPGRKSDMMGQKHIMQNCCLDAVVS